MARLDYKGRYTRCPANPCPAFPTQSEIWLPLVDITLVHGGQSLSTEALLDTGAGVTMFATDYADAFGIDWSSAPTVPIIGIAGGVDGHVVNVRLAITGAGYGWDADVAFCPNLPMPLLGHRGFFEHFEVRFRAGRSYRIHLR